MCGYTIDMHMGEANAAGFGLHMHNRNYSTWLFGNHTISLIRAHAADAATRDLVGLFVYLAFNAVHDTVELPLEYTALMQNETEEHLSVANGKGVLPPRLRFAEALGLAVSRSSHADPPEARALGDRGGRRSGAA